MESHKKRSKSHYLKQPCWKQPHFNFLFFAIYRAVSNSLTAGASGFDFASQVLRKVAKRPFGRREMSEIETARNRNKN